MEAFLTFGTMFFSVVALVCALVFLVRRAPLWLAAIYSWIALGVVAGNASLLALGYWQSAAKHPTDHYAFAGTVVVLSIMALIPALIAQSVHSFRR